jgi:integrase
MAETQLYLSARIGEVSGLQWSNINFNTGKIEIANVAVYLEKRFYALKEHTKNGEHLLQYFHLRHHSLRNEADFL